MFWNVAMENFVKYWNQRIVTLSAAQCVENVSSARILAIDKSLQFRFFLRAGPIANYEMMKCVQIIGTVARHRYKVSSNLLRVLRCQPRVVICQPFERIVAN